MLAKENTDRKAEEAANQTSADSEKAPFSRSRTEVPRGPYWLLVADQDSVNGSARSGHGGDIRDTVFLLEVVDGKVLPIFCSEEKADLFLASLIAHGDEGGYHKRYTWAAELLSVLTASPYSHGPCAGVEKVALDPLREEADGSEDGMRCMDRRCFQDHLMGRKAGWFRDARESLTS